MKTTINNLPNEILLAVFQKIESTKDLADCRVVCQRWSSLAEKTMLGRTIRLTNAQFILKFHRFLTMRPASAEHIKSLNLVNVADALPTLKELLKLAFTPSIKELSGKIDQDMSEHLLTIMKDSTTRFSKIRCLPNATQNNGSFVEMQLYLRESLQRLHTSNGNSISTSVIDRLGEFSSLVELELEYKDKPDSLTELDKILSKCNKLQTLELELVSEGSHTMEPSELQIWLSRKVQKNESLRTLEVKDVEGPHAIEYLGYKYPNLREVIIKQFFEGAEGSAVRILDAIKDIDIVELSSWYMDDIDEFKTLIEMTRSKTNNVQMKRSYFSIEDTRLKFSIQRNKRREITTFEIEMNDNEPQAFYEDIIKSIGSVSCLEIDYLGNRDEDHGEGSSFFNLLKIIPNIESLKFADMLIALPPASDTLVLNNLVRLRISGAIVDEGVIPKLSKIAPNLKHLTFDTCILDSENRQNHRISLPETYLETLSLMTGSIYMQYDNGLARDGLRCIEEDIRIGLNKIVMLRLITETQNKHLILRTTDLSGEMQEDFAGSITINCKSLGHLSINLGNLFTEVDFNRETQMEKSVAKQLSRLLLENPEGA